MDLRNSVTFTVTVFMYRETQMYVFEKDLHLTTSGGLYIMTCHSPDITVLFLLSLRLFNCVSYNV